MANKKGSKHDPRGMTAADIEMGKRLRLRRVELSISQQELADALGVSFQQVQKYEKGINRIGASRLDQIAKALSVPVTFFYPQSTKAEQEVQSLLFTDSSFALRLLRAYTGIKRQQVQRSFVNLMEALASE